MAAVVTQTEVRKCFPDIRAIPPKAKSTANFFIATNGELEHFYICRNREISLGSGPPFSCCGDPAGPVLRAHFLQRAWRRAVTPRRLGAETETTRLQKDYKPDRFVLPTLRRLITMRAYDTSYGT
jgi:hypothetical protein